MKSTHNKLVYVFPPNDNFRERKPELMFSDFYGLIDGYSLLFDPLIMAVTRTVPEYSNGFPDEMEPGTFIISGSGKTVIPERVFSGLVVRSEETNSRKASLKLGKYSMVYPAGMPCSIFRESACNNWVLNGQCILRRDDEVYSLGVELFKLLSGFRECKPEARLIIFADILVELLGVTLCRETENLPVIPDSLRLDCQAYGCNRFLINWLGELFSGKVDFSGADRDYLQAVDLAVSGDSEAAKTKLTSAFQNLAKIRRIYSKSTFKFVEIPHIGILFDDAGFFEFERPEFTRMRIEKQLDFTENSSCKTAFEAGMSCWKNFAALYPETIKRLSRLKKAGKTSVTNGTFSLPYAQYSPVGVQYWQFEFGINEYHNIFASETTPVYQCQENSFTPITPQLLNHFAYKSALHIVQNRGKSPTVEKQFFKWRGADGSTIQSIGVTREELGRKGVNYFYDLPVILKENTQPDEIYYPSFQDIGFIPLRTQIYRSTNFADIWGEFLLPEDIPYINIDNEHFFQPEDYCLAEAEFYDRPTCINSLSQLDRVYRQYNKLRMLQFQAWGTGQLGKIFPALHSMVPEILLQEAHDVVACQGQKVGEFYKSNILLETIRKGRCLSQKADELSRDFDRNLSAIAKVIENNIPYPGMGFSAPEVTVEDNKLYLELCGTTFIIAIFDRRRGGFEIKGFEEKTDHVVIEAEYRENDTPLHQVNLSLYWEPDISLLELQLNYSTLAEFSYLDKWGDCLGISVAVENGLGKLVHNSSGYRTEAYKSLIISPYFLSAETGFSLLNEGAPYYEKIDGNTIGWIFHNYGESVHHRRMAVYLGKIDPVLASGNWTYGYKPGSIESRFNLPEYFSAEVFIAADKLLAVSLRELDISGIDNISVPGHREKPEKINAGTLVIFSR